MSKKQQSKTKLGKAFAKMRIDLDMNRVDMAQKLGITDQALGRIEEGKSQVTDDFLVSVANMANMIDSDQYDEVNTCGLLETLRYCNVSSVKTVTFEMESLTFEQRESVMRLRDSIEYENAEKMKAAEEEAERQRAAKKAERLAKKASAKATPMPVPEEVKTKPVKSEAMVMLEEAAVTTATEMPSLLAPVTTVDVTTKSVKAAAPVIDEDEELAAMLADLENLPS